MISVYKTISNLIDKTESKELTWTLDNNIKAFVCVKEISDDKTLHFEIFPTLSGIKLYAYIYSKDNGRKYIFNGIEDDSLTFLIQKIVKHIKT